MLINLRQEIFIFQYFFGKFECPWAHELTSQTGGELMSWFPSVSAALVLIDAYLKIFSNWMLWLKRKHLRSQDFLSAMGMTSLGLLFYLFAWHKEVFHVYLL